MSVGWGIEGYPGVMPAKAVSLHPQPHGIERASRHPNFRWDDAMLLFVSPTEVGSFYQNTG